MQIRRLFIQMSKRQMSRRRRAARLARRCLRLVLLSSLAICYMVSLKRVLAALLPVLSAPSRAIQLLPFISSAIPPTSTFSQYQEDILAAADILEQEGFLPSTLTPRPEQSGQRITKEWLEDLGERDCLWQFRYVLCARVLCHLNSYH